MSNNPGTMEDNADGMVAMSTSVQQFRTKLEELKQLERQKEDLAAQIVTKRNEVAQCKVEVGKGMLDLRPAIENWYKLHDDALSATEPEQQALDNVMEQM